MDPADRGGTGVGTAPAPVGPARAGAPQPVLRPRRLAGLDGLRALAIVAVLVFHLDPHWLPGGFLGVDVFFVVSGFLITTLLVREHTATGRVDLRTFWARRARRLLPALLLVVPSAVLLARLTESDLLVGVGRQVLGALTFTSNWLEVAAGSDYFAATAPTLLANLWSLAVEEQFYLVWPLVTLLLLRLLPRTAPRVGVALGLAGLSTVLMAVRLDPEAPTRVYYGTDTHVMGLMLGAALAFAWAAPHRAWTTDPRWVRVRRPLGVAALTTLALLVALLDEGSALTFRGGILLASLATAALVLVVVERPGRLRALLELPAARWLGARSYGIYLWHWPVLLVVGQDVPVTPGGGGWVLTRGWAVLVTLAAADLSYRFVETPVRRLGVRGAVAALLGRVRVGGPRRARVVWGLAAALAVTLVVVLVTAPTRTSTEELLRAGEADLARAAAATPTTRATPTARPSARPTTARPTSSTPTARPAATTVRQPWTMPTGAEIDAFGDSMLVGSVHAMRYYFPSVRVDARSNRRWSALPGLITARGTVRRAVVLSFGTNGGTDLAALRRALTALGPDRMVVVLTLHGPFSRVERDNAALREAVAGYRNVALADWDAALADTSGMLQSDGIHPSIRGAHVYARAVQQAFARLSEQHTGRKVTLRTLSMP